MGKWRQRRSRIPFWLRFGHSTDDNVAIEGEEDTAACISYKAGGKIKMTKLFEMRKKRSDFSNDADRAKVKSLKIGQLLKRSEKRRWRP